MTPLSADWIKRALCDLTVVEPSPLGFEVALAQVYANGEVVTVFIEISGNGFNVHDGGNAAMILEGSGVSLTSSIAVHLQRSIRPYDCQFERGRVWRQCGSIEEIAACAATVGCASRLVADFSQQAEGVPKFDFRHQLVEALREIVSASRIRENDEVIAKTGTKYLVSATILDEKASKPIAFVEAVTGKQSVTRKFRAFYDLRNTPLLGQTKRVAIYDDVKTDVTSGDLALLRDVCIPIGFSHRNENPAYRGLLH